MTRNAALKHLFELDPAGAREAILRDLQNPNADPGMDVVQLLSKEDLAPVVRSATERIEKGGERQLDFELVDRYAGDSALPVVRAAFEKNAGRWGCATQSSMLRYFLRVSPEYGAKEVSASLAARKNTGCYRSLLEDLGDRLPKAQQSAIDALNDPDAEVALSAARALGRWGSKDAEPALWERLKRVHKEWEGRQDELRLSLDPKNAGSRGEALEQALVTAIGAGTSWACPPDKLARLSELVWTKVQKRQIEGWAKQWEQGSAVIETTWFPEDTPTFSVLQYTSLTEDQLVAKVAQLPQSMELQWRFWPAGTISPPVSMEKQEAAYERVRAAAAGQGIVITKADR
jgi:hypothetical protein